MFKVSKFVVFAFVASALEISDEDRQLICDSSTIPYPPHRQASIRWLPFPKTKHSFASTIWHYGCNIDPGVSVADFENRFDFRLNEAYPLEDWCPKLVDHSPGSHKPIGEREWACHKGHFVTLVREPSQRVMSAYKSSTEGNDHQCILDCNPENSRTHFVCDAVGDKKRLNSTTCKPLHAAHCPADYVAALPGQACQTKMILGYPCSADMLLGDRDIEEAIDRITDGFSFVGVMEEYELSMCLFHRILGGDMYESESASFPHTPQEEFEVPDDCPAEAFDEMDMPVYNAAKQHFEKKVRQVLRELRGEADFHAGPDPDIEPARPAYCKEALLKA